MVDHIVPENKVSIEQNSSNDRGEANIELAQAAEAVTPPPQGLPLTITVVPDQTITIDGFNLADATLTQQGPNLIINMPGQGPIVLEGYFYFLDTPQPPVLVEADGDQISADVLAQSVPDLDLTGIDTAAGPQPAPADATGGGGGAGFDPFDPSALGDGLGTEDLLAGTELSFGQIDQEPEDLGPLAEAEEVVTEPEPGTPRMLINEIGLGTGDPYQWISSEEIQSSFSEGGGGTGWNFIEFHNAGDADADLVAGEFQYQTLGQDGKVTVNYLPEDVTVPAGGFLVIYQSTGEIEGSAQTLLFVVDAGGNVVSEIDLGYASYWDFGPDTGYQTGVLIAGSGVEADVFIANVHDLGTISGVLSLWNVAEAGDDFANNAILSEFFDHNSFNGMLTAPVPYILDHLAKSGLITDPDVVNQLEAMAQQASEWLSDTNNNSFSRVFGGDDETPIDTDSANDWTTANAATDGAINDSDDDLNWFDDNDDLNPDQGDHGAGDSDAGQTILVADADNPNLYGGSGPDFLYGGNGETDQGEGQAVDNLLDGEANNDFVYGGGGDDRSFGGSGGDVVVDIDGADVLVGGTGKDLLIAWEQVGEFLDGYGEYDAPALAAAVDGYGEGNIPNPDGDLLVGDNLYTAGGDSDQPTDNDVIIASDDSDVVFGDNLPLFGLDPKDPSVSNYQIFDNVTDNVLGLIEDDPVNPDDPDGLLDSLHAEGEADFIYGAGGDDIIFGQGGDDIILGGYGSDLIYGGDGADMIQGNEDDDTILGGRGNDRIEGNDGEDSLYGEDGDDTMYGNDDADTMDGGAGNDTMYGGDGNDTMLGGMGADLMYGNADNDQMFGEDDADTMFGGTGNDYMEGNDGADIMSGDDGNDSMFGGAGEDVMYGNADADFMYGNGDDDRMDGGTGNDFMDGGSGNDIMSGGDGNDVMVGGDGEDIMYGNADSDSMYGNADADVMFGGDGVDYMRGGTGNDSMDGGADNDFMYGEEDDDTMDGQGGTDYMFGGDGNDTMDGGAEGDVMYGNADDDLMYGGTGNDFLSGDEGADTMYGDADNDSMLGGDGSDTMDGGTGNDFMYGNADDDLMYGGDGNDVMWGDESNPYQPDGGDDTMYGQDGSDVMLGGSGNDTMDGGADHDTMYGNAGDDLMYGGTGNDSLIGEDGVDTMYGETGNDYMSGGDRNDIMDGGEGNDTLYGGAGNDTIDGGTGDDAIYYYNGEGEDTVDGGADVDVYTVRGQYDAAADAFSVDQGVVPGHFDVTVQGETSDLTNIEHVEFYSSSENDDLTINGDFASTTLSTDAAGPGQETGAFYFEAGEGDDRLDGEGITTNHGITAFGDAGVDTLLGGAGQDYLDGGTEDDLVVGGDNADHIEGGDGADLLVGDSFREPILTGEVFGNDPQTIVEQEPNDIAPDAQLILREQFGTDPTDLDVPAAVRHLPYVKADGFTEDANDQDLFKVYLHAGEVIYVDLDYGDEAGTDRVDTVVTIFDEDGNRVAQDIDRGGLGPDPYIAGYTVLEDGYYYIGVTPEGNVPSTIAEGDFGTGTLADATGDWILQIVIDPIEQYTIDGETFEDTINGGNGADLIFGDNAPLFDADTDDSNADILADVQANVLDRIEGSNDPLHPDDPNGLFDAINAIGEADDISGGAGNDYIFGQGGDDTIDGDGGEDVIYGGHGVDTISGGADADMIIGGAGDDILSGDGGGDTFGYTDSETDGNDSIVDFEIGADTINLDALFDALGIADADRAGDVVQTVDSGNLVLTIDGVDSSVFSITLDGLGGETLTIGDDDTYDVNVGTLS